MRTKVSKAGIAGLLSLALAACSDGDGSAPADVSSEGEAATTRCPHFSVSLDQQVTAGRADDLRLSFIIFKFDFYFAKGTREFLGLNGAQVVTLFEVGPSQYSVFDALGGCRGGVPNGAGGASGAPDGGSGGSTQQCIRSVTVSETKDGAPGSLRAAVDEANSLTDCDVFIRVSSGEYDLTQCGADDANAAGDLDVTTHHAVTILATNPGVVIKQTCTGERVFDVRGAGAFTLDSVTVTGGNIVAASSSEVAEGGGVRVERDLTLSGATVTGNSATGVPPSQGASSDAGAPPNASSGARGGGVFVGGALHARNSTIQSNRADSGARASDATEVGLAEGGGVFARGAVTFDGGLVSDNHAMGSEASFTTRDASTARGGGLAQPADATGDAKITGTTFSKNDAAGADAQGGGVFAARRLVLSNATFDANTVNVRWVFQKLDWSSTGEPVIQGTGEGKGGAVASAGDVADTGSHFTSNRSIAPDTFGFPLTGPSGQSAHGGAISADTLTLTESVLTGNQASGHGGAVQCRTLTAKGIEVASNKAGERGGGGIAVSGDATIEGSNFHENAVSSLLGDAAGGGIWVEGALKLTDSTVSRNQGASGPIEAYSLGPLEFGINGGPGNGLFRGGGIAAKSLEAERVTIADNQIQGQTRAVPLLDAHVHAQAGTSGGAGVACTGTATLRNATLSGNLALSNHGAAVLAPSVDLQFSTVAANAGLASFGAPLGQSLDLKSTGTVAVAAGPAVCGKDVVTRASSYDWFSDSTCGLVGTGDHQGEAVFALSPLAGASGKLAVRTPGPGSVLVDAVPSFACPVRVDALGQPRPVGLACDIGAVEAPARVASGVANVAVAFDTPPSSVPPGADATWTAKVTNSGPSAAAFSLEVSVAPGLTVTALTSDSGGLCSPSAPASCSFAGLAAGATAKVTFTTHTDPTLTGPVSASVTARGLNLVAPFTDDTATVTVASSGQAAITWSVRADGGVAEFDVTNSGNAVIYGSPEEPIEFHFHPAPGVHLTPDATSPGTWNPTTNVASYGFAFDPGYGLGQFYGAGPRLRVAATFDGAPPSVVTTVDIVTPRPLSTPAPTLTVYATDIGCQLVRDPSGTPNAFRATVTNHGPAAVTNLFSAIEVSGPGDGALSFEMPSQGTISSLGGWNIPSLAPGESATVRGVPSTTATRIDCRTATSQAIDVDTSNDTSSLTY